MITEELLEIIKIEDNGMLLNDLYDEFRDGRNPNDILILLNSNDDMIGFGCDICCEIRIKDVTTQKQIIEKLNEVLLYNNNDFNRTRSFHALCGFYMDNNDTKGLLTLCQELLKDKDEYIRNDALKLIDKYK